MFINFEFDIIQTKTFDTTFRKDWIRKTVVVKSPKSLALTCFCPFTFEKLDTPVRFKMPH